MFLPTSSLTVAKLYLCQTATMRAVSFTPACLLTVAELQNRHLSYTVCTEYMYALNLGFILNAYIIIS